MSPQRVLTPILCRKGGGGGVSATCGVVEFYNHFWRRTQNQNKTSNIYDTVLKASVEEANFRGRVGSGRVRSGRVGRKRLVLIPSALPFPTARLFTAVFTAAKQAVGVFVKAR